MKYKVVGAIDIFLSILFSLVQIGLLFFVYPKLFALYNDFNVQLPVMTKYTYAISLGFLTLFILFFIVGVKLFKSPNQKLFVAGIFALVIMLLSSRYLIGISVLGAIGPLYSVTSNL